MARQERVGGRRSGRSRGSGRPRTPTWSTNSFATRWRFRRILRPSRDHRRDRGEVAADEHEVGDAPGHLRARSPGDREPRRLQRRDVVDAVADHRHVAARVAQRLDDAPLALGRDPPDHGRSRAPAARSSSPVLRQLAPVERRRRSAMPASAAIAATVVGRVAGDDLQLDALRAEERHRRARVGAQLLREDDEPERRAGRPAARRASASSGRVGACRRRARAARPLLSRRPRAPSSAEREAARARRGRSVVVAQASALQRAARRERHVSPRSLGASPGCAAAIASSVAFRAGDAGRETAERAASSLVGPTPAAGSSVDDAQARLRQRAGLVEADDVDGGERLDRVQLLRERAAPRHAQRRDRVRQARQQDQALRDEA